MLLSQRQEQIAFTSQIMYSDNGKCLGWMKNEDHYLHGSPKAAKVGSIAQMVAWVKEDQRRSQLPAVPNLNRPSAVQTPLDPEEITSALSKISKNAGWRYHQKTGVAYLECNNREQRDRIFKTLERCHCAHVISGNRTDNKVPVVKCTNFNLSRLRSLAAPLLAPDLSSNVKKCIDAAENAKFVKSF